MRLSTKREQACLAEPDSGEKNPQRGINEVAHPESHIFGWNEPIIVSQQIDSPVFFP
jgi:hypothetical protein